MKTLRMAPPAPAAPRHGGRQVLCFRMDETQCAVFSCGKRVGNTSRAPGKPRKARLTTKAIISDLT
jgi:hypothetical protein